MSYATASDLRDRIGKISQDKDVTLDALIAASEVAINRFANLPDGFAADVLATARIYAGSGKSYQLIDECAAITLVAVKESPTDTTYTSWAAADWIAFYGDPQDPEFQPLTRGKPYNAIMTAAGGPYFSFISGSYSSAWGDVGGNRRMKSVPTVQVTARWGYALTVPPDIREACLMQATRWYKRFEGGMSDALASGELGQLLYRQALDPDVRQIIVNGRYIKPSVGRW
jgi:hypothetical protein